MKKLILALDLCCSFCAVSNAIWLTLFFPQPTYAWDEDGHCFACKESGKAEDCNNCEKYKKEHYL